MSVLSVLRKRLWPDTAPPPSPRTDDEPAEHACDDPAVRSEKAKSDALHKELLELENTVKAGEAAERQGRNLDDAVADLLKTGELQGMTAAAVQADLPAVHERIRIVRRAIERHSEIQAPRARRDWARRREAWLKQTPAVRELYARIRESARDLLADVRELRSTFASCNVGDARVNFGLFDDGEIEPVEKCVADLAQIGAWQ